MIDNKIGYSYNDLTIVPQWISNIKSRSECDPLYDNNTLPIFTAPMTAVVNEHNYMEYENNNIIPVIPRSVSLGTRIKLGNMGKWIAVSLKEFKSFIDTQFIDFKNAEDVIRICIDVANGHMKQLYDISFKAKHLMHDKLSLMVGNIANAYTYKYINSLKDKDGSRLIDFVRCGIGGGSGCFVDGTKVKTINGDKNIEDIEIGDKVLTIDNSYQKVLSKIRYKTNELIKINNEIISTKNHKYFVIDKKDKDIVNEQNLEKLGYWVAASELDKDKHLLVKLI